MKIKIKKGTEVGKGFGARYYMTKEEKLIKNEAVICIIGLGYVGQPLAE